MHLISSVGVVGVYVVGLANKSIIDCDRGNETLGVVDEHLPFRHVIMRGLIWLLIIVVLE